MEIEVLGKYLNLFKGNKKVVIYSTVILIELLVVGYLLTYSNLPDTGIGSENKVEKPPIFILVGESINAEHTGKCYNYTRNNTPNICNLADDGVKFENAYSQGTWTPVAVPTFMTGRSPREVGMKDWNSRLEEDSKTFLTHISRTGYETLILGPHYFESNFFPDADNFREINTENAWGRNTGLEPRLRTRSGNLNMVFYKLAHFPYKHHYISPKSDRYRKWDELNTTKAEMKKVNGSNWGQFQKEISPEEVINLYDQELRMLDYKVGRTVQQLKREGKYNEAMIIFMADHGERFTDRSNGFATHSGTPTEDVAKTPLIIKFPNNSYAGKTVKKPVRHIDLPKTILDYLDIENDFGKLSASFLPLLEGEPERYNPIIFSAQNPNKNWMIRDQEMKYHLSNMTKCEKKVVNFRNEKLFNLNEDPDETTNIIHENLIKATQLREKLCELYNSGNKRYTESDQKDERVKKRLKDLGYLN